MSIFVSLVGCNVPDIVSSLTSILISNDPFPTVLFASQLRSHNDPINFVLLLCSQKYIGLSIPQIRKLYKGFGSTINILTHPFDNNVISSPKKRKIEIETVSEAQIPPDPVPVTEQHISQLLELLRSPQSSPFLCLLCKPLKVDLNSPQNRDLALSLIERLLAESAAKDAVDLLNEYLSLNSHINARDFISKLIIINDIQSLDSYLTNKKRRDKFYEIIDTECTLLIAKITSDLALYNLPANEIVKLSAVSKVGSKFCKKYKFECTDSINTGRTLSHIAWLCRTLIGEFNKNGGGVSEQVELLFDAANGCEMIVKQTVISTILDGTQSLELVKTIAEKLEVIDYFEKSTYGKDFISRQEDKKQEDFYDYSGPIVFVQSVASAEFRDLQSAGGEVVGLDCEWMPIVGAQMETLSIIQLAFDLPERKVFIIDMLSIEPSFSNYLNEIFASKIIVAFGFDGSDMILLRKKFSDLKIPKNLIDFGERSINGIGKKVSLANVVKNLVGKGVDKSVRLSNWNRRPLNNEQLKYAATDAAVLLDLFRTRKQKM